MKKEKNKLRNCGDNEFIAYHMMLDKENPPTKKELADLGVHVED